VEADWLVAGLGNPGPAYAGTRHNLGFAVLDRLAGQRFRPAAREAEAAWRRVDGAPVLLIKPQTFMNRSGDAVGGWLEQLGLSSERLIVVHDDLDLPVGRVRISAEAGPGGHRGVASIQARLGTTQFPRVRVGIGRPEAGEAAEERVLRGFSADEMPRIETALPEAALAVEAIIRQGVAAAMNQYNRREPSGPPDESSDVSSEKAR
jgi:peptidyl-tRNA hydrolase, PTH1 family